MSPAHFITTFMFIYLQLTNVSAAEEPTQCREVVFADTGWSDATVTTAVATTILQGLGYETTVRPLTLPSTYAALATDDVDVFLGHWAPVMDMQIEPYLEEGAIEIVRANLTDARYALATNKSGHTLGIKTVGDIPKHHAALNGQIYGVKPDNGGNFSIEGMIAENKDDLGTFEIIEHSEQGLFAQVELKNESDEPALFMAWEPHPLNTRTDPVFLEGSERLFGSDSEAAAVQTITSAGYSQTCQNIGKFLENLEFTAEIESFLIEEILVNGEMPDASAKRWISKNRNIVTAWLDDMITVDGNDPESALSVFLDE